MSESPEKNVVALLEEHVELAISTVRQLRAEKLELEAEIARLNGDVLQRDARIQELEANHSELNEAYESEKLTAQEERAGIRQRLEELMTVLADTSEAVASDADKDVVDEAAEESIVFTTGSVTTAVDVKKDTEA